MAIVGDYNLNQIIKHMEAKGLSWKAEMRGTEDDFMSNYVFQCVRTKQMGISSSLMHRIIKVSHLTNNRRCSNCYCNSMAHQSEVPSKL